MEAHTKAKGREGRPTEVLIGNRPIPLKKLRKTATAMATAQKRKADGNAHAGSVQKPFRHKRPRRTAMGPDDPTGEDQVPCM